MLTYIPALSLLAFFLCLLVLFFNKMTAEQIIGIFEKANSVLLSSVFIFMLVSLIHLFVSPSWTPDLLKVIAGIIAGSAVQQVKTSSSTEGRHFSAETVGNNNEIALGDINKIKQDIQAMHGNISSIRDAIINQVSDPTFAPGSTQPANSVREYLFLTSFFATGEPLGEISTDVQQMEAEGWHLVSISNAYGPSDADRGVLAVLSRIRPAGASDQQLRKGLYKTRFYHGTEQTELLA